MPRTCLTKLRRDDSLKSIIPGGTHLQLKIKNPAVNPNKNELLHERPRIRIVRYILGCRPRAVSRKMCRRLLHEHSKKKIDLDGAGIGRCPDSRGAIFSAATFEAID